MKRGTPSATAQAAAAVRALESLLPKGQRLFEDPYASYFLKSWHRGLLTACKKSKKVRDFVESRLERSFPGVPGDFICRTRVIDDYLLEALESGKESKPIERLVILGAGYDTRLLRIAALRGLPVTELDHPDTQAIKRATIEKLIGQALSVDWVPHDLVNEPADLSAPSGQKVRIFWILEGVTGYLPSAALDKLLAWMGRNSAPESVVVMTYVHQSWVDGKPDDLSAQIILQHLKKSGEPFVSGWSPETLKAQCAQYGIKIIEDESEADFASRYPELSQRKLRFLTGFRIARGVISL